MPRLAKSSPTPLRLLQFRRRFRSPAPHSAANLVQVKANMFSLFKNRDKPRVGNRFATVAHEVKRLVYGQDAQFLTDDIIPVDLAKYFFHDHQTAPIPWTNDWAALLFFADVFEDWAMPSDCRKFIQKV